MDDKTNALTAVETILAQVVLEGRMVTMEALLPHRHVAPTIVDKGGDYGMIVKENQPPLRADIARVFELGRQVMFQKTGKERVEGVYGGTSLGPERATPERLLTWVRGQGQIDNQAHWVRDVTCDADRSQVRCGTIPQGMAALRNTTIGLLRYAGYANMAAAGHRGWPPSRYKR